MRYFRQPEKIKQTLFVMLSEPKQGDVDESFGDSD